MERRRLVTLGLVLVMLLFALFLSPFGKGLLARRSLIARLPAALKPTTPAPPPPPAPVLAAAELENWRRQHATPLSRDPFFTAAEERRGPVQVAEAPPAAPVPPLPAPPTYTVKMVLISGAAKVAAIDGRIVSEGEMLGDERVVEIQTGGVVLERGGRRRVVEVAGGAMPTIEVAPR